MSEITDRIYELSAGRLNNELTAEEDVELNGLLAQSIEYRHLYDRIECLHRNVKLLRPVQKPDVEAILKKVKARKKKHPMFVVMIRYAAILILPLCIGLWYQLSEKQESITTERDFSSISIPGSSKAVLSLGNKQRILLDQLTIGKRIATEEGAFIATDSNSVLSYLYDSTKEQKRIEWNTLSVPRGGEYCLLLGDGTKIWLNSSSELSFPQVFTKGERRVKLSGEAFFEVAKDSLDPFVVEVNQMEVKVLGTKFNINSYKSAGDVYTTLVEGGVEISNGQKKTLRLVPGEQAFSNSQQLTKKEVNMAPYISWRDGKFTFSNTDLGEICEQLSRWYDVDIFFTSEEIKTVRFTGAILKFRPLEEMIRMIEQTSSVRFRVKNKTILISEN
ncbi:MAG: DUF4974 domain-containing protein [Odoribacter sp.]